MARLIADLIGRTPNLLNAMSERVLDLRGNGVAVIKNLDATEERSAAAKKFHSKEAEEEAKTVAVKASTPVKVVDTVGTTKEQDPKVVAPPPAEIIAIKTEASEETFNMETDGQDKWNGAEEQKHDEESTPIEEEIMGADPDPVPGTHQLQIEEYIYRNFQQQRLYNVMSSRRNTPYHGIHIIPPPRRQEPGDCAYHATLGTMESDYKALYARRPDGMVREFHVRLSHEHLKQMVLNFIAGEENFRPRDRLAVCLLMAKTYGVVSQADWEAGLVHEGVRYRIDHYSELSDRQMRAIPSLLDNGKSVLTSFRVTDTYRRLLPHDIYRYVAEEDTTMVRQSHKETVTHESHCVVLISHGQAYKQLHEVRKLADLTTPERYYEFLNSYSAGYGVDGCGYIYADSIRRSYFVRVANV